MNIAIRKAQEVYQKYGNNLDNILEKVGIEVLEVPLEGRVKEIFFKDFIVLKEGLSEEEKRELIAHALAHHFLHAGNHYTFSNTTYSYGNYHERQANVFATYLLIPDHELKKTLYPEISPYQLAEKFQITPSFVEFRLNLAQNYTPSMFSLNWRTA